MRHREVIPPIGPQQRVTLTTSERIVNMDAHSRQRGLQGAGQGLGCAIVPGARAGRQDQHACRRTLCRRAAPLDDLAVAGLAARHEARHHLCAISL
jgi:hypothetical protein